MSARVPRTLLALFATAASAAAVAPSARAADEPRIIVGYEQGVGQAGRSGVLRGADVSLIPAAAPLRTEVVEPARGVDVASALAELRADPRVAYAEVDGELEPTQAPPDRAPLTDTYGSAQWSLRASNDVDLDAVEAWNLSRGAGALIGVIDTEFEFDHPDLVGQWAPNPGEIAGNGIDDDGNGYVDDRYGWNAADWNGNPFGTDQSHGTHVAGIAAGARDGQGTAGVAPEARIVPVRATGSDGSATWSSVAAAIDYLGGRGVQVVNISLGGPGSSTTIRNAMNRWPNVLFVVAAGNSAVNVDQSPVAPCTTPVPNILCVGATTTSDTLASFSNYGTSKVLASAPGVGVVSSVPTGRWASMSGTSMASPNAAGVAALVASASSLRGTALRALLLQTADRPAALSGRIQNSARLNAWSAVRAVRPDRDDDGVADAVDVCPDEWSADPSGCLAGGAARDDADADGVDDAIDNCPVVSNGDQLDINGNGIGDACETARSGDAAGAPAPAPAPAPVVTPAPAPVPATPAPRVETQPRSGSSDASRRAASTVRSSARVSRRKLRLKLRSDSATKVVVRVTSVRSKTSTVERRAVIRTVSLHADRTRTVSISRLQRGYARITIAVDGTERTLVRRVR